MYQNSPFLFSKADRRQIGAALVTGFVTLLYKCQDYLAKKRPLHYPFLNCIILICGE